MTIKFLVAASGMTQKSFAEYFGIPKRTIESWCMEDRKCPPYLVELIAYKLKSENLISDTQ